MIVRVLSLTLLILFVSGCGIIQVNSGDEAPAVPVAGLYKTANAGNLWSRIGVLYRIQEEPLTVRYSTITVIQEDPLDPNTVYLGTDVGIYYTHDRGQGWFETLTGQGIVNDISIDPTNKCIIYAAVHNKIMKTSDCARSWDQVHFSSLAGEFFNAVHVRSDNPSTILVGSSHGKLLESTNAGISWQVKEFTNTAITDFLSNPRDEQTFYMVTSQLGIQRTRDGGATWEQLNLLPVNDENGNRMKDPSGNDVALRLLPGSNTFYDLKFDTSQEEGLIYASGYGIFRLIGGTVWQEIDILDKPNNQRIFSIALDGNTGQNVYFATTGAFYQSVNGGVDWSVKNLPATGIPNTLYLFPGSTQELIIGFDAPPQR